MSQPKSSMVPAKQPAAAPAFWEPKGPLDDGAAALVGAIEDRSSPQDHSERVLLGTFSRKTVRVLHAIKHFRRNKKEFLDPVLTQVRNEMGSRLFAAHVNEGVTNYRRTRRLEVAGNKSSALAATLFGLATFSVVLGAALSLPLLAPVLSSLHNFALAQLAWASGVAQGFYTKIAIQLPLPVRSVLDLVTFCVAFVIDHMPRPVTIAGIVWLGYRSVLFSDRRRYPGYARDRDDPELLSFLPTSPNETVMVAGPKRLWKSALKILRKEDKHLGNKSVPDRARVETGSHIDSTFTGGLDGVLSILELWQVKLDKREARRTRISGLAAFARACTKSAIDRVFTDANIEAFSRGFFFDNLYSRGTERDAMAIARYAFPNAAVDKEARMSPDERDASHLFWLREADIPREMAFSQIEEGLLVGAAVSHDGQTNASRFGSVSDPRGESTSLIDAKASAFADPRLLSMRGLTLEWWGAAVRNAVAGGVSRGFAELRSCLKTVAIVAFVGYVAHLGGLLRVAPTDAALSLVQLSLLLLLTGCAVQAVASAIGSLRAVVGAAIDAKRRA